MNCKQGDLARIVAPFGEWGIDHFVTVLRASASEELLDGSVYVNTSGGHSWVCSGAVPDYQGHIQRLLMIADACLRPIRGGDETETPADIINEVSTCS